MYADCGGEHIEEIKLDLDLDRDTHNGTQSRYSALSLSPIHVWESPAEEHDKMPLLMFMLRRRLHFLPVFTAVFIISSFFLSYGISVYHGHVEPDFPYISYAAIHAPERCIFAQLINIGAFLLAVNIYIRYLQMCQVLQLLNGTRRDSRVNTVSIGIGWVSAFGLSVVANFQTVDMRAIHYTGAGLAFILGTVYCWLQTWLSLRHRRWSLVTGAQLLNSCLLSAFLAIFIVSKSVYKTRKAQGHGTKWDALRGVYLTSTISEWLTAASIVTFLLTFYTDFSRVEFRSPTVSISDRDVVLQDFSGTSRTSAAVKQNGHINGHANSFV